MVKRRGTFLEQSVANLFKKAGFETEVGNNDHDFEIDVLAKREEFKVVVECKQYDNSYINISSLLHEWRSKGEISEADRTIVVVAGMEIPEKFYTLARNLGIYLIGDEEIHYLLSLDKEDLKEKLNEKISFDIEEQIQKEKLAKKKSLEKWALAIGISILVLSGILYFLL
ncbi:MAG: restriction endonuclease [Candidatus Pacearchaeota archaeon]